MSKENHSLDIYELLDHCKNSNKNHYNLLKVIAHIHTPTNTKSTNTLPRYVQTILESKSMLLKKSVQAEVDILENFNKELRQLVKERKEKWLRVQSYEYLFFWHPLHTVELILDSMDDSFKNLRVNSKLKDVHDLKKTIDAFYKLLPKIENALKATNIPVTNIKYKTKYRALKSKCNLRNAARHVNIIKPIEVNDENIEQLRSDFKILRKCLENLD
ncbi:MAG: hypothetical protein OXC46_08085 [Thaumarchaeota archaeon]|nr:hypothetical protein [Nitrososphaerota archaeon]